MATVTMPDGTVEVPPGTTIEDAVRASGRTPDSFIYLVSGMPVPMDTVPDSDVRALRVASGG